MNNMLTPESVNQSKVLIQNSKNVNENDKKKLN